MTCTRHATLTACYQLAQSVLNIGSAVAERVRQGEVGGVTIMSFLMSGRGRGDEPRQS